MTAPIHTVRAAAFATAGLLVASTTSCSSPATEEDVCAAYAAVNDELMMGNLGLGDPLFDAIGDLGDAASSYEDDSAVQSDGAALQEIADSDSTSRAEVMQASVNVSALCGS